MAGGLIAVNQPAPTFSPGVYWCARAVKRIASANHHFVLIVGLTNTVEQAGYHTIRHLGHHFATFGGNWTSMRLSLEVNSDADVRIVRKYLDGRATRDHLDPGLRFEGKFVSQARPVPEFASTLLGHISAYGAKPHAKLPYYKGLSDNCATWVNTLFQAVGIPESVRKTLGDFWGIDIGQEQELEGTLFAPTTSTYRLPPRSYVALGAAAAKVDPEERAAFAQLCTAENFTTSEYAEHLQNVKKKLFVGVNDLAVADSHRNKAYSALASASPDGYSAFYRRSVLPRPVEDVYNEVLSNNRQTLQSVLGTSLRQFRERSREEFLDLESRFDELLGVDLGLLASTETKEQLRNFSHRLQQALPPELLDRLNLPQSQQILVVERISAILLSGSLKIVDLTALVDDASAALDDDIRARAQGVFKVMDRFGQIASDVDALADQFNSGTIQIDDADSLLLAAADVLPERSAALIERAVEIYKSAQDVVDAGRQIKVLFSSFGEDDMKEVGALLRRRGEESLQKAFTVADLSQAVNAGAASVYELSLALGLKGKDQKHAAEAVKVIEGVTAAATAYATGGYAGLAVHAVSFLATRKQKAAPDPQQLRFEAIMAQFGLVQRKLNEIRENQVLILGNQQKLMVALEDLGNSIHQRFNEVFDEIEKLTTLAANVEEALFEDLRAKFAPLANLARAASGWEREPARLHTALESLWRRPKELRTALWSALSDSSRLVAEFHGPDQNPFPSFMRFETEGLRRHARLDADYAVFKRTVYQPMLDYLETVTPSVDEHFVALANPCLAFLRGENPYAKDELNSEIQVGERLRALGEFLNPRMVLWATKLILFSSTVLDFVDMSQDTVSSPNFVLSPSEILSSRNQPDPDWIRERLLTLRSARAALETNISQLALLSGESLYEIARQQLHDISSQNANQKLREALFWNPLFRDNVLRWTFKRYISALGLQPAREYQRLIDSITRRVESTDGSLLEVKLTPAEQNVLPFSSRVFAVAPTAALYISLGPWGPSTPTNNDRGCRFFENLLLVPLPHPESLARTAPNYPKQLSALLLARMELNRRIRFLSGDFKESEDEALLDLLLRQ